MMMLSNFNQRRGVEGIVTNISRDELDCITTTSFYIVGILRYTWLKSDLGEIREMSQKLTTLNDVAALAGVSYQTVSRVINNSSAVAEKTRLNVFSAMETLNYIPNQVAQKLAGKQIYTLGLATTDLALHAPSKIASAIKKQANELGYSVVISMTQELEAAAVKKAVNELLAQRVDGIIINIPLNNEQAIEINELCCNTFVVFLDIDPVSPLRSIMTNSFEGGVQGARHLVELGHKSIALIQGPESSISSQLRLQGWMKVLNAEDIQPFSLLRGDWSAESGYQLGCRLVAYPKKPSAILVANDQMALGVLRALHESGIDVPNQISVIGYDDTDDSAYFYPPLTTIRQDFDLLGRKAAEFMINLLAKSNIAPIQSVLPTELVIRQTTSIFQLNHELNSYKLAQQLRNIANKLSNA